MTAPTDIGQIEVRDKWGGKPRDVAQLHTPDIDLHAERCSRVGQFLKCCAMARIDWGRPIDVVKIHFVP